MAATDLNTHEHEQTYLATHQQLLPHSPKAAATLAAIRQECGVQIAYYATFVLMYLEACISNRGAQALASISAADLKGFTFFAMTQHLPKAQTLFHQALECYRTERQQSARHEGRVRSIPWWQKATP